uniref:(northern house mosquito) hypothetical protein n=1 Tax=Culex pipiens TaxID=7175 RepID=A0A8D8AAF3_CULPI
MYCGEECRQKSWNLWHQFECPVAPKLRNFSNFNLLSTPRQFFYDLFLFDDNLAELKRFYEANEGAELSRFELEYSNLGQRVLFKIVHNTDARRNPIGELNGYLGEKLISNGYFLVFQANPLMITATTGRRNYTIQNLNKLARLATTLLSNNHDYLGRNISWIFPAIPANIHTCDPNAHTAFESGRMKMVLLRPVAAGQPFVESFGPTWWSSDPEPRPPGMSCSCAACDDGPRGRVWRAQLHRKPPPETAKDFAVAAQVLSSDSIGDAAKLNALQQFIKRHGHVHPAVQVGQILERYRLLLTKAIHAERGAQNRAQLQAAYVEQ